MLEHTGSIVCLTLNRLASIYKGHAIINIVCDNLWIWLDNVRVNENYDTALELDEKEVKIKTQKRHPRYF